MKHAHTGSTIMLSTLARQQQIRDVREAAQQHEPHDAEKEQRHALQVAAEHDVAEFQSYAAAFVRHRLFAREIRCDSRKVVTGRFERNAGLSRATVCSM
jgi:Spy/CpxP family protein refolding chaperone